MYSDGVITLAPFERTDLQRVQAWVNDPDMARDVNRVRPVTGIEHEKWYADLVTRADAVTFAVSHKGQTIGLCGLKTIDNRSRHAELWIYVGEPSSRGQGLGRRAIDLLTQFGFDQLNLHRIHLYVAAYNEKAVRTYLACGFQEEGRFRDYIFIDGAYHDAVWMAVFASDRSASTAESYAAAECTV